METSLMAYYVELIATAIEDQLSDAWENAENHKASILEQIQEVKTVLDQLKIKTEQQQQKTTMPGKEGVQVGETVQITT